MSSLAAAGVALIGVGYLARRFGPQIGRAVPNMEKKARALLGESRYKGGFQSDIDKYEAGKILGTV